MAKRVKVGKLLEVIPEDVKDDVYQGIKKLATEEYNGLRDLIQDFTSKTYDHLGQYTLYHNARPKNRLGQCSYRKMEIEVHPWLLEHDPKEYRDTLVHEIAHAVSNKIFGRAGQGHGPRWHETMAAMGYPNAKRCGHIGIPERYRYSCRDCEVVYKRHRKLSAEWYRRCGKCSSKRQNPLTTGILDRLDTETGTWAYNPKVPLTKHGEQYELQLA